MTLSIFGGAAIEALTEDFRDTTGATDRGRGLCPRMLVAACPESSSLTSSNTMQRVRSSLLLDPPSHSFKRLVSVVTHMSARRKSSGKWSRTRKTWRRRDPCDISVYNGQGWSCDGYQRGDASDGNFAVEGVLFGGNGCVVNQLRAPQENLEHAQHEIGAGLILLGSLFTRVQRAARQDSDGSNS